MQTEFTPIAGLVGGMLIGLAAVMLLATIGRIAGVSGIVGGMLAPRRGDVAWRVAFVAGLLLGGLAYALVQGELFAVELQASWPVLAAAGFLVGFGTRMGGGCTSGHGVCGIARFSRRSIVATAVFMGTAMTTVLIARHLLA